VDGFTDVPNDFIEGTLVNMAEYRYDNDPLLYGSGVISPYDCMIYPLSVAGWSVRLGYMFTSYDSEFYGHGYSIFLEWWEWNRYMWVQHSTLVAQTSCTNWNPLHHQNIITPDFLEGYRAKIQWRYKMTVFATGMSLTTPWHTNYIYPSIIPPL
jgi:hypothetical protein